MNGVCFVLQVLDELDEDAIDLTEEEEKELLAEVNIGTLGCS